MRLTRIRAAVAVAALAVAGTGVAAGLAIAPAAAAPAHPASAHPASASAASATKVVLVNQCSGKGQVKPKGKINLPGCMASSELIQHAAWTSWTSVAFGKADFTVNNCSPSSSCGPSKYTKYPVLMVLWRAKHWTGGTGHEDYFSRMTVIFTGKRPSGKPATRTFTFLPDAG
jgi:hypothetical protein